MDTTAAERRARNQRFMRNDPPPPVPKRTMAWSGGKITSNKDEATRRFLLKRISQGKTLTPAQQTEYDRIFSADTSDEKKADAGVPPSRGEGLKEPTKVEEERASEERAAGAPSTHATNAERQAEGIVAAEPSLSVAASEKPKPGADSKGETVVTTDLESGMGSMSLDDEALHPSSTTAVATASPSAVSAGESCAVSE